MTDKPGTPLPSLDQIVADPRSLKGLSPKALRALSIQALLVVHACEIAELESESEAPEDPTADETLDVKAAARLIGISPHTLRNRARTTPYASLQIPTGTRRMAFSRRRILEWQQQPPADSPRVTPKAPPGGAPLAGARRRLNPQRTANNFNPPFLGWRSTL